MLPLHKLLKTWRREKEFLISPPFHNQKDYAHCKQALTRAWLHADYNDQQRIVRIPYGIATTTGKSNEEKLVKLKVFE
jgi:hypothetical protein